MPLIDIQPMFQKGIATSANFINYLLIAIVIGLIFWAWLYFRSFNIDVEIIEKTRNEQKLIRADRARRKTVDGLTFYELLKNKNIKIRPPGTVDEVYLKWFGSKVREHLKLFMTHDGSIYHVPFSNPIPALSVQHSDLRLWGVLQHKQTDEIYRKPGFWEKYGQQILMFGFFGLMLAAIIVVLNKFEILDKVSSNLVEVAKTMKEIKQPTLP